MGLPSDIEYKVAGTLFEASIDATAGAILWFIVAMLLYPDARKTAQAELDNLLGDSGALPTLSQLRDLPYCVALVKEV
jgi:cytochrome P450